MFKTAADPFKKAHVFQTGAKLGSNWGQNRVASLVKLPLQKVKNDLARVKSVLNRGAKTWCSALRINDLRPETADFLRFEWAYVRV